MKLPILYSRTSTGAVQTWEIEVEGNKFRVTSGQEDGKKVVNEFTTCQGKNLGKTNETSPETQAKSEAQAKWDKKCKTGYCVDIKKIDKCLTYVEPMLAKNLDDRIDKINFKSGVLVQNKYNGFRCTAQLENGKVVLKSRKGELYLSVPHINQDLEDFFETYPEAFLDGELYNNDLREKLNEMCKLVRKSKHTTFEDLAQSERLVRFYIYDGYNFSACLEEDSPYEARKTWINEHLPKYSKYYREVKTEMVHSMVEVDRIFGEYLADKQEGCIVRIPNAPYEHKRSATLLKYKPENDDEGTILDVKEGTGNWAGTGKVITFKWKGKIFNGTLMGSWENAVEVLKNKKDWIGKEVTFKYTGLTGKGVPNDARLDPSNCFKGDR